jgi:molybdenum cofactor cytidylyltransferase
MDQSIDEQMTFTQAQGMNKIAIAILAAGQGTRMRGVKQLALFEGETLLSRALKTATNSRVGDVFIVLGHNGNELARHVGSTVTILRNKAPEEGIASSVRTATDAISNLDHDALMFMTIDQPFVDAELLRTLSSVFSSTRKSVVASKYGTPGIPALFAREKFPDLLSLKGDKGAKQLIVASDAHLVDAPLAKYDIDTEQDLESLASKNRRGLA